MGRVAQHERAVFDRIQGGSRPGLRDEKTSSPWVGQRATASTRRGRTKLANGRCSKSSIG
jgi:hypothetical protein